MDRLTHDLGQPEPEARPPWVLKISSLSIPFAGPGPAWKPFFDRLRQRFRDDKVLAELSAGLEEKYRRMVVAAAIRSLMDEPEDALPARAQGYLESTFGKIDLIVEGICLADPSKNRDGVREIVGNWPMTAVADMVIGPADSS